jgi:hypothetical protein
MSPGAMTFGLEMETCSSGRRKEEETARFDSVGVGIYLGDADMCVFDEVACCRAFV